MKVRPIFWYVLAGVLTAALFWGAWGHVQATREPGQGEPLGDEQEYSVQAEKTNTASFLAALAVQAESLDTELMLFTTTEAAETNGYSCQVSAAGAYNDLTALLSWLGDQSCAAEIRQFDLKKDPNGAMQLVVELVLW